MIFLMGLICHGTYYITIYGQSVTRNTQNTCLLKMHAKRGIRTEYLIENGSISLL